MICNINYPFVSSCFYIKTSFIWSVFENLESLARRFSNVKTNT